METIVSYLPLPASSALLTTGAAETQGAYLSTQASLIVMAAYACLSDCDGHDIDSGSGPHVLVVIVKTRAVTSTAAPIPRHSTQES